MTGEQMQLDSICDAEVLWLLAPPPDWPGRAGAACKQACHRGRQAVLQENHPDRRGATTLLLMPIWLWWTPLLTTGTIICC